MFTVQDLEYLRYQNQILVHTCADPANPSFQLTLDFRNGSCGSSDAPPWTHVCDQCRSISTRWVLICHRVPLFDVHKDKTLCVSDLKISSFTLVRTCPHIRTWPFFLRALFLFFFNPTSRQPLSVSPTQLSDFCNNLSKVVLQVFPL